MALLEHLAMELEFIAELAIGTSEPQRPSDAREQFTKSHLVSYLRHHIPP